MTNAAENTVKVYEATLSRRQFVKTGGALFVGVAFVGPSLLKAQGFQAPKVTGAPFKNSLDPTQLNSWIEIHPDNTVLIRTGKSDFGQGTTFTAYRQIPPHLHHHLQSHGKRNLGHRHPPPRNVAWAHGASENAWLHARLCRPARQIQIPQFSSSCEKKSRRSRRSYRVGSYSSVAAG